MARVGREEQPAAKRAELDETGANRLGGQPSVCVQIERAYRRPVADWHAKTPTHGARGHGEGALLVGPDSDPVGL
jgi:hypothetical protein